MRYYVRNLLCYCKCEDEKLKNLNSNLNLNRFPKSIETEIIEYFEYRGSTSTLSSIKDELAGLHHLGDFLYENYPELQMFENIDVEEMLEVAQRWVTFKTASLPNSKRSQYLYGLLRKEIKSIYKYYNPKAFSFSYESDIWYLDGIPLMVRQNLIHMTDSLNFKGIKRDSVKKETKEVVYYMLARDSAITVKGVLNRITEFLSWVEDNYSVSSLRDIDRKMVEGFWLHIKTDRQSKGIEQKILYLRMFFDAAAIELEKIELSYLVCPMDIPRRTTPIYKTYSKNELNRLNTEIVLMDEQIGRALIIHELIGTRICDTLTLTIDGVGYENGYMVLTVMPTKTRRGYQIPVNKDVELLINKSIEYTNMKYGQTKYIFVRNDKPSMPMTYAKIQSQLTRMIKDKQLKDDNGKLFGVGTHRFRRTYAKTLTEMGIPDLVIAKLLGHSGTRSLKHYRKMGYPEMAESTKVYRQTMDVIIDEIVKGWDW